MFYSTVITSSVRTTYSFVLVRLVAREASCADLPLRSFPQETQQIPTEEVALDICLSNGQKVTVNILSSDQTEDVLDVSGRSGGGVRR